MHPHGHKHYDAGSHGCRRRRSGYASAMRGTYAHSLPITSWPITECNRFFLLFVGLVAFRVSILGGVLHLHPGALRILPVAWFQLVGMGVKNLSLWGPELVARFTHTVDDPERSLPPRLQLYSPHRPWSEILHPIMDLVWGSCTSIGINLVLHNTLCSIQGIGYLDVDHLHFSNQSEASMHSWVGVRGRPPRALCLPKTISYGDSLEIGSGVSCRIRKTLGRASTQVRS